MNKIETSNATPEQQEDDFSSMQEGMDILKEIVADEENEHIRHIGVLNSESELNNANRLRIAERKRAIMDRLLFMLFKSTSDIDCEEELNKFREKLISIGVV